MSSWWPISGKRSIPCPICGSHDFTDIRKFNLMFKTFQGVTEDSQAEIYLRPETAQGIFVNFKNVQRTTRRKIPFGICQIGKSFRNEITPGNFTFRTREFEQMELEFFCEPGTDLEWFAYWRSFCYHWLIDLGLPAGGSPHPRPCEGRAGLLFQGHDRFRIHFPFGWGELWGIADRTDFDLKQHIEFAREDLSYFDPATNEKYVPYVIEPSLGADRVALAFLCAAYDEEEIWHPAMCAPSCASRRRWRRSRSPSCRCRPSCPTRPSRSIHKLSKKWFCEFDDRQSIGKRYRRQDEIGTPYCVTFDFDSLKTSASPSASATAWPRSGCRSTNWNAILTEKLTCVNAEIRFRENLNARQWDNLKEDLSMTKYVYMFSEGNAGMRNLLGGKGANLAEMTGLGPARAARLHDYDRSLHPLL